MNYNEALLVLKKFYNPKFTLGLKNIQALMDYLGNPQDELAIIHVAGTNGKGSVSQFISHMLTAGGYRTGVFNSPYLVKINEQITINQQEISDEDLCGLVCKVVSAAEGLHEKGVFPSYFEIVTAIALLYFYHQKVDFVVLEVGLGGAYDATNVINEAVVSVITKISIDHTDYLGDTIEAIAKEKAGIIKKSGLVVSPVQQEEVLHILKERCKATGASLHLARTDEIAVLSCNEEGTVFTLEGQTYHTKLIGEHQAYNCAIALKTIQCLREKAVIDLSDEQIRQGVFAARWPGRFEKVADNPPVFIDGAHNGDGVTALRDIFKYLQYDHKIAILGILADKEVDKMLGIIADQFDEVVVTKPVNPRALDVDILAEKVSPYVGRVHRNEDVVEAVKRAMEIAKTKPGSCVVAFGSLYMIGAVRHYLMDSL